MRIQATALMLSLSSIGAFAAPWEQIAEFPAVIAEINTSSVKTRSDLVEGTFRFHYPSPQTNRRMSGEYLSAEVKVLFDCRKKQFVPYHRTEFEGAKSGGAIIDTISIPNPETRLAAIIPDSMNERMLRSACSTKPK